MRPKVRQAEIVELVRRHGQVTVEDLARRFRTSHETIRRDLTSLAETAAVQKFHGGAKLPKPSEEGPFRERMALNADAKREIARKLRTLLSPGDTVFVDSGSTTLYAAAAIADIPALTVVTNSSRIAEALAGRAAGGEVFLLGGRFDGDNRETVGPTAIAQLAMFRADHAVITIGAMHPETGAADFNFDEAQVARAMIEHAERLIVLADSSKLGRRAAFQVCPLDAIDALVTDAAPAEPMRTALENARVVVR